MESSSYSGLPKKKSNVGLIIAIVVGVLFLCCGGLVISGVIVAKKAMGGAGDMFACTNSLGDYRDAILAYAKKHNGKLPPAKTWQDDVKPFLVKTQLRGPLTPGTPAKDPETTCDASLPSSVTFNSSLAGKSLSSLENREETVLVFETPGTGKNQAAKFTQQPFSTSPIFMFGKRRGWIEQPIEGPAFVFNEKGVKSPLPKMKQSGSTIEVEQN